MGGYVCEICQDTFTRQEHLERHTMSRMFSPWIDKRRLIDDIV